MDNEGETIRRANVCRCRGGAATYDRYRPQPPDVLVATLCRFTSRGKPELVVDLGCGTGLSTCIWSGKARRIVGLEPNSEYLQVARQRTSDPCIEFRLGYSHDTGVGDGEADIVTCVQALHWMEPRSTFCEIDRILRSGGVFAHVYSDMFPVIAPDVDQAVEGCLRAADRLAQERQLLSGQRTWGETDIDTEIQRSERFCYIRKFGLHAIEHVTVDALIGRIKTGGNVATVLAAGGTENELAIDTLRAVAVRQLVDGSIACPLSFYVTVCVKR